MSDNDLSSLTKFLDRERPQSAPSGRMFTTIDEEAFNLVISHVIMGTEGGESVVLGHVYAVKTRGSVYPEIPPVRVESQDERRNLMLSLHSGEVTDCFLSLRSGYTGFGKFSHIWRNEVKDET